MFLDTIGDKIITDIDVASLLATWSSTIILQFDDTLIILIDNIVMDIVSLLFQRVLVPYNLCQDIIHPENINLIWTISV